MAMLRRQQRESEIMRERERGLQRRRKERQGLGVLLKEVTGDGAPASRRQRGKAWSGAPLPNQNEHGGGRALFLRRK